MLFKGTATALITPFTENGVDYPALERILDLQLKGGVNAMVVLGTTGEPATMTEAERIEVMKFTLRRLKGKMPVIIGTGCNNTASAVKWSRDAEKLGADGVLVVTPYYNKATQGGLIAHYTAIADGIGIPIIAYNVPGRTGVNLLPETFARIAEHKNIAALKEASGNIEQISEASRLSKGKAVIYSGDDAIILPVLSVGGMGVISVASNVIPAFVKGLTDAYFTGDLKEALAKQHQMSALVKSLFSEVNPIPVKKAAAIMGLCDARMRLPLTEMTEANAAVLKERLGEFI